MMATGWRMGGLRMRASSGGRAVTGHGRLATPRRARASLLTARANFRPRGLSSLRQTSPGPNRPLPERMPLGSRRGPRPSVAAMASKPDVGDRISVRALPAPLARRPPVRQVLLQRVSAGLAPGASAAAHQGLLHPALRIAHRILRIVLRRGAELQFLAVRAFPGHANHFAGHPAHW